jgi:hypothetical protein
MSSLGFVGQADLGRGDFIEELRGVLGVLTALKIAQEGALADHRRLDDVLVLLVRRDSE